MNRIKKTTCAVLLMLPLVSQAQYIKLVGNADRDALYFNLDRVWNYNLYEHSRWGGGLMYAHNWGQSPHWRFTTDIYAGYGVGDKHMKWGATFDLMRDAGREQHFYVAATYDLASAGNRRLEAYSLLDFTSNTGFMSSRMAHVERAALGWRGGMTQRLTAGAEASYSSEVDLYCSTGLLYPSDYHDTNYPAGRATYAEGRLTASHSSGLKGELKGGAEFRSGAVFVRLLAQYRREWKMGFLSADLFVQAGVADGVGHRVPYSRKFDLGGSLGCPLGLRHTLLTVQPCEFTADAFVLAVGRLQTAKPLFDLYSRVWTVGTRPSPFVQASAVWGALWGQSPDEVYYCPLPPYDQLPLQAPHHGLAEAAVGVDGLLRWGLADFGVSAAYRLTPASAPYHRIEPLGNLALNVTAVISL